MSDGIERETPMTAAALIKALEGFPPDTPVFSSGEFTMAVAEVRAAHVSESDRSMSGYEDSHDETPPNAVLLI